MRFSKHYVLFALLVVPCLISTLSAQTYTEVPGSTTYSPNPTSGPGVTTTSRPEGTLTIYGTDFSGTLTDGGQSLGYMVTQNSTTTGYNLSLNSYRTLSTGAIETDGVTIRTHNDPAGNDVLSYTFDLDTPPSGYAAQIELFQPGISNGNIEASEFTISWTGGSGDAIYYDSPTPSTPAQNMIEKQYYRFGAPSGFDVENRQIIGLENTGTIPNGDTFEIYSVQNKVARWYVQFPIGATSVTVTKRTFNGGAGARDNKFPILGFAQAPGQSFTEWIAFRVNLYRINPDTSIPTLGEWGLLILALLMLTVSAVALKSQIWETK